MPCTARQSTRIKERTVQYATDLHGPDETARGQAKARRTPGSGPWVLRRLWATIPIDTSVVEINRSVSIKAVPPTALNVVRGGKGRYHGSNILAWPKVEEKGEEK
jgi:hypothetical protein